MAPSTYHITTPRYHTLSLSLIHYIHPINRSNRSIALRCSCHAHRHRQNKNGPGKGGGLEKWQLALYQTAFLDMMEDHCQSMFSVDASDQDKDKGSDQDQSSLLDVLHAIAVQCFGMTMSQEEWTVPLSLPVKKEKIEVVKKEEKKEETKVEKKEEPKIEKKEEKKTAAAAAAAGVSDTEHSTTDDGNGHFNGGLSAAAAAAADDGGDDADSDSTWRTITTPKKSNHPDVGKDKGTWER